MLSYRDYRFINILVFSVVSVLLLYAKSGLQWITCPYAAMGAECVTCGLTTSFRRMLSGQFREIASGHLWLFLAFGLQLLLRPGITLLLKHTRKLSLIGYTDILLTTALFGTALALLLFP